MKKITMAIVAISAMISLSGCHKEPAYVDSYFQRQSVIEKLSNELKGQYSNIFIPVVYNNTSLNFMLLQQRIQISHSLIYDLIACSGSSRTRQ